MEENDFRPQADKFSAGVALVFGIIALTLAAFLWPTRGHAQQIYTVYDYAHEAKFEIYDPISPKRFQVITDSLMSIYDCSEALSGCKWVEQPFTLNMNGGYSDCSIRQIVIYKNPPNRLKRRYTDWITAYSDTSYYCANDLNSYEIFHFEKRGFTMVDTCEYERNLPVITPAVITTQEIWSDMGESIPRPIATQPITIEDVKNIISFGGELGISMKELVEIAYLKALQEGKTEGEAIKAALDKVGGLLNIFAKALKND